MPRIIFKCPYIKGGAPGTAAHLGNYVRYMATREGAQRVAPDQSQLPATKKQQDMVERLIRDFPLSRGMFEYEDFLSSPTRGNASEFITRALEDNYDQIAKRENYVSYIASRPRAQHTGAHALFTGSDDPLVLSRIADDVAHHPGNVWLPIISLRREDAARLGDDDAERWRTFLSGYAMEMARAMKIPWEQFRWYAAFHDEAHHPHVHMVCYSADGKSGYLTKDGIAQIKSGLAKQIFRQELHELYEQQTQRRDELAQEAGAVLAELVQQMQAGTLDNPHIEQLMENLARRLKTCSGKKQYGYLQTPLKSVVDEIVDELAKDPRVASAYGLWYELREEVLRSYKNDLPERLPLSQQKEFKRIKNLVIQEALRLNELDAVFLPKNLPQEQVEDDSHGDDETPAEEPLTSEDIPQEFNPPEAVPPAMAWSSRYRQARLFLFGGDAYPQDFAQAFDLFMEEAHAGNALAMHDLGRMYADGLGLECDEALAQEWYEKALNAFLALEAAKPNRYVEYRIGWMLLHGIGTVKNETAARRWFEKSAAVNNPNAQYQLAKIILADSASGPEQVNAALEWLTKAAEAGQNYAQYALGKLLLRGDGVPKDAAAAVRWLTAAADRGSSIAQYTLAAVYLAGEDIPKDAPKALDLLRQSASRGNEFAQYRLGKLLLQGEEAPKDVAEAIRQLTLSAEQGNQYAQYALGKLYLLGKEIPQDRAAAIHWFTLSAAQGNEHAQYFLDHRNDFRGPSAFTCATQLLHHLGRLFQDRTQRAPIRGIAITDRKLRRRIQEKKMAMGHKADDHEDAGITMQ